MTLKKTLPALIFIIYSFTASAQNYLSSVKYERLQPVTKAETELPLPAHFELEKVQDRKQLMNYLKEVDVSNVGYNQSKVKNLYHLANLFTKLRLYPLAMKCFLKTLQLKQPVADSLLTGNVPVTLKDDTLLTNKVLIGNKEIKSKNISSQQIINTFNDGKTAVAYAMVFHVKQPVRGKKTIFVLGNTGHTFITLIKYNTDSTYTSASFGFYPKKGNPLAATPLIPTASSTFKDDSEHQWDEVVGKFISKKRFNKVLNLTQQYNNVTYHLSNNNCTDFALKASALAGINVLNTTGKWPLGHGNNPALTGQSILDAKFNNADTGDDNDLFVDLNLTEK